MRDDYYIDKRGYYRYRDSGRLVSRHIAAKYVVGRRLKRYEVVHHINGNKLDNRPENLRVMTRGEHSALHGHDGCLDCSSCLGIVLVLMFIATLPFIMQWLL